MNIPVDAVLAFLTGAASVAGSTWALRRARREEQDRCDRRISEIRGAYDRGMNMGLHMDERHG